jgi:hemolysin activation/secretion protein
VIARTTAILIGVIAAAVVPCAAVAQVIPPSEQPGRERERFVTPPPPLSQPGGPTFVLPSTAPPAGAARISIFVRDICIRGGTIYRKEDLAPLYADMVGREVPVQAIYDLAQRITARYGKDGYVLSRAIVPPQQFNPKSAVPCLQIVEGYIDNVEWPKAVARYRDFFTDYTRKITAERPVNVHTIERYMLLAGDLPGLKFSASLKPSKSETGAATLIVEVAEKPLDVFGTIDNRGTPARGPVQFLTSATANNILGAHETFTAVWAATTRMQELEYFAGNYRQVLNSEGLFAFVNGSYGFGHPGTSQLELLNYKTKSTVVEAGLASPLIRTREANLTLAGLVFMSDSFSDVFDQPFQQDRLRGVRLRAYGDWADQFLGINQANMTFSQGIHGLGSSNNGDVLLSRPVGRVDFSKIEATLSRTQPLVGAFSAFGSLYGQYAFNSLLAPEQCGYGGRYYGRAYDPSQILGDHCFEAIGELRYDLPAFMPFMTQAQLYGYTDYGKLWLLSPAPPVLGVGTPASTDAASAGAGVRLAWWNQVSADLSVAKAIHGPRDDTRFFFIVSGKY